MKNVQKVIHTLILLSISTLSQVGKAEIPLCEGISGDWFWDNRFEVTLYGYDDGWAYGVDRGHPIFGQWSCNPTTKAVSVEWNTGFTDSLTLAADGYRLVGTNNAKATVTAKKIFPHSDCSSIPGDYLYDTRGFPATLSSNGHVAATDAGTARYARWYCTNPNGEIVVKWNETQNIDHLQLKKDWRLVGFNHFSPATEIIAKRILIPGRTSPEVPTDYPADQAFTNALLQALRNSPLSLYEKAQHILNRLSYGPSVSSPIHSLVRHTSGALDVEKSHRAMIRFIVWSVQPNHLNDSTNEALLATAYPEGSQTYEQISEYYRQYLRDRTTLRATYDQAVAALALDPNNTAKQAAVAAASLALQIQSQNYFNRASLHRRFVQGRMLGGAVNRDYAFQNKLAMIWFNRLNVNGDKVPFDVTDYLTTITAYSHGKFEDMLLASARHPAMSVYLNNAYNRTDLAGVRPNEDYAREIMELHTLGIPAGVESNSNQYNLADVRAAARVLSGWGLYGYAATDTGPRSFKFYPNRNANGGIKTVMGQTFADGEQGGIDFIRYLARHRLTARSISRMLMMHLVNENYNAADAAPLTTILENDFLETGGNLQSLYKRLLAHDAFWARSSYRNKGKDPFTQVVSVLRSSQTARGALTNDDIVYALQRTDAMGMRLFECIPPTGFPLRSGNWISASSTLSWLQYAYVEATPRSGVAAYEAAEDNVRYHKKYSLLSYAKAKAEGYFITLYDESMLYDQYAWSSAKLTNLTNAAFNRPDKRGSTELYIRSMGGVVFGGADFRKH